MSDTRKDRDIEARSTGQQAGKTNEKIIMGRISGAHGVQGWVKIYSWTDPMESIVDYSPWYIRPKPVNAAADPNDSAQGSWQTIKLKSGRKHGKTVIAKLEYCNDRDAAEALFGYDIAIDAEQLEALQSENEYYWRDLIGLQVVNRQQEVLGTVKNLMETGANDVLVVHSDEDKCERLVPWTPGNAIDEVDLESKTIYVDWDTDF